MDAGTLILVLLVPLLLLGPSIMILLMLTRRLELERPAAEGVPADRPWWGNPLLWLALSAVSVLLGIFVAPQLFGGVIVFLPFVWVGSQGPKRRDAR